MPATAFAVIAVIAIIGAGAAGGMFVTALYSTKIVTVNQNLTRDLTRTTTTTSLVPEDLTKLFTTTRLLETVSTGATSTATQTTTEFQTLTKYVTQMQYNTVTETTAATSTYSTVLTQATTVAASSTSLTSSTSSSQTSNTSSSSSSSNISSTSSSTSTTGATTSSSSTTNTTTAATTSSSSSSSTNHISMLGAVQVVQGGAETASFVKGVASQGLRWDRDNWQTTNLAWDNQAGINLIAVISSDPETSCGSGVLQSESNYKSTILSVVSNLPWVHYWEFGNEVQIYWCNISPQNYFQGLIWANEAIRSVSGHASDVMIGGGSISVYTYAPSGVWNGYDNCAQVSCLSAWNGQQDQEPEWFLSFWKLSLTDSFGSWTPADILDYVSIHVYTEGQQWTDKPAQGPYSTVQSMLTACLNLYESITGNSKQFIVTETGFRADTAGGTSAQNQWYQGMVPFYQSLPYIYGVFAYALYDTQTQLWGLFTSSLQARPAWFTYSAWF